MGRANLDLRAIGQEDVGSIARFLSTHLNTRVPPDRWRPVLEPPWASAAPNRGFQLVDPEGVVGAYVAVYSQREIAGSTVRFCNLAAFCVREDQRAHSLRLIRPLLAQPGFVFTDLSPSGAVVDLDRRLGFRPLDTATRLVVNVPRTPGRGIRISSDPAVVRETLQGADAAIHRDHADAPAAHHVVVTSGADYAYVVYRRDRRRGRRLFASPLFAGGDRDLLRAQWGALCGHFLTRGRLPFTLAEARVLGFEPPRGVQLAHPRPKMLKGDGVAPEDVDHLYSELALLEW